MPLDFDSSAFSPGDFETGGDTGTASVSVVAVASATPRRKRGATASAVAVARTDHSDVEVIPSRAKCVVTVGTLIEDFAYEDLSEWTVDTNFYAAQAAYLGSTMDRLTFAAQRKSMTTTDPVWFTKTISLNLAGLTTPAMSLKTWTNVDYSSATGFTRFLTRIEFSSTSDFSKKFSWTSQIMTGGMNNFLIGVDDWTNTGSESWSNTMIRLRVGIVPYSSVHIGKLPYFGPFELRGAVEITPAVMIGFSNARDTAYTVAKPLLDARDMKATIHLSDINLEVPGFLTGAHYRAFANAGWTIGPTLDMAYIGAEHASSSNLADHRLLREAMQASATALVDETGLTNANYFTYWAVAPTRLSDAIVKAFRDWNVRTVMNSTLADLSPPLPENVYDCARYTIYNHYCTVIGGYTKASILDLIDKAKAAGRTLFLLFKDLQDTPTGEEFGTQDFEDILDYIISEDIETMTLEEWYEFASDNPAPSAESVILGDLDLNDQVNYFVESTGLAIGQPQTTWDETVSYSGNENAQTNVRRAALVPITIPMRVHGVSVADIDSKLAAVWVEVDKMTNTLLIGTESYAIVNSTRPDTIERDSRFQLDHDAYFTLVLMREP